MFTGLIREFATVVSYSDNLLTLKAAYKPKIGDSIAINGACLTAMRLNGDTFSVELSKESRDVIAKENLTGLVHMEPAMQLGERLDGHMVQGHIDGVGTIASITKNENATDIVVTIPKELMKFMIPKGSIAIDGVSLTLNDVLEDGVRLTIIPHTMKDTLFANYKPGRRVNVESDLFARYIYNMFKRDKKVTWDDVDHIMSMY